MPSRAPRAGMIEIIEGPLVVQPAAWTLVFAREAKTRWVGWLAMGRYKHVRAYAYVPFLHVWIFYDPHLWGTDIFLAADGEPAAAVRRVWNHNADLLIVARETSPSRAPALLGFCVPAIKRLLGIRCSALRPKTLYAHCVRNGCTRLSAAGHGPGLCAPARAEQAGHQ